MVDVVHGAPYHLHGRTRRGRCAARATRCESRCSAREATRRPGRRPGRARPRRASRRSRTHLALAARRRRDPLRRRHDGLSRHGHRHREAHRGPSAPRSTTTCSTWSSRARSSPSPSSRSRRAPRRQRSGRRADAVLYVGGTGLYGRAVLDDLEIPGRYPEVRAELDARVEATSRGSTTQLDALDPLAASRMEPTNARRIVRALEVTHRRGAALLLLRRGTATATDRCASSRWGCDADFERARRSASSERFRDWMDEGLLDEVRGARERAGRAEPHRPPGRGLPRAAAPRRGRRGPRGLRRRGRSPRAGASRAASDRGSSVTRASSGSTTPAARARAARRGPEQPRRVRARLGASGTTNPSEMARRRATTSSSRSIDHGTAPWWTPATCARRVRPHDRAWAPTGCCSPTVGPVTSHGALQRRRLARRDVGQRRSAASRRRCARATQRDRGTRSTS